MGAGTGRVDAWTDKVRLVGQRMGALQWHDEGLIVPVVAVVYALAEAIIVVSGIATCRL